MPRLRVVTSALVAVLLAASWACTPGAPSELPVPASAQPAACPQGRTRTSGPDDWPTYHLTNARTGNLARGGAFRSLQAGWAAALDGPVYANPLVAGDLVVVPTENDSVYALDRASGCVHWRTSLGRPVDARDYRCGNIPTLGVTSTPAIDPATHTVYVNAYVAPGEHHLFAIDLATGRIRWEQRSDLPGTDPTVQLNRAALMVANGRVYVPYGGRAGDCGDFLGSIQGFPLHGGTPVSWHPPTVREGGIWAPGGPILAANGDLLVAVGNTDSQDPAEYDGGHALTRLGPDLRQLGLYHVPNWVELNRIDFDLGSTSPVPVFPDRVFQVGKEGIGYLLDVSGADPKLVFKDSLNGCYAIGAAAYRAPWVYVPCDHGMKAVHVSHDHFGVGWASRDFRSGSPIVAGDTVWNIDFEKGHLYGFDLRGSLVARARLPVAQHFVSPSAAAGHLFVPAGRTLFTYRYDG